MSLFHYADGYYDETGSWQVTKYCFAYCEERCTCEPPSGVYQLTGEALEQHLEELKQLSIKE